MSYSRRQLYAMGEPLGDCATFRKADGGVILGGGGDSGPAPAPTGGTTTRTDLPEWAVGSAQDVLAKGTALTDISQNPYQQYGGQRTAGFSELQNQAFAGAGPQGFQNTIGAYMSPYMDNVVRQQQRNAMEQAAIQSGALNAKAAQMNAFGGSGVALQRAAQGRDLQRQLGDIQATGAQNAFQQATSQYNTGQQQLASLGALQQAQEQKGLDVGYQNFLNQQNYPYQQLSYMANLVRGTPMGMNSSSQVFQAGPTSAQTLAALGAGAYGLSKMAADGGLMESYADGGSVARYNGEQGSVTSQGNVDKIVHELKTDAELQRALKAAQARGDVDQIEAVQDELAMRASLRRGLAGAVTNDMADRFAGGGILAFAERGAVDSGAKSTDEELATPMSDDDIDALLARTDDVGGGAIRVNPQIAQIANQLAAYNPRQYTPSQIAALDRYNYQRVQSDAGPNTAAENYQKRLTERAGAIARDFERAKGLAALAAIPTILQPGGTIRGLGGGGAKWAAGMEQAIAAQRLSEEHLAKAEFDLSDAMRKERQGLHKDAQALTTSYVKNQQEGEKLRNLAQAKAGELLVKQQQAQAIAARAGKGGDKLPQVDRQAAAIAQQIVDLKGKNPNDPAIKPLQDKLTELKAIIATGKDMGPNKMEAATNTLTAAQNRDLSKHMSEFVNSAAYKKAEKAGTADDLYNQEASRKTAELMQGIGTRAAPIKID